MKKRESKKQTQFGGVDAIVLIAAAALAVLLCTAVNALTNINDYLCAVFFASVYSASALAFLLYRRSGQFRSGAVPSSAMGMVLAESVAGSPLPVLLCPADSEKILWMNKASATLAGKRRPSELSELFELSDGHYICDGRIFTRDCYKSGGDEVTYRVFVLTDITDYVKNEKLLEGRECAVAYIVVDNLDELMSYEQEDYRGASSETEQLLRGWAMSAGGVLKEYQQDKYIFIFEKSHLDEFCAHGFDILDRIREIRLGDSSLPVTVSIGVSGTGHDLTEKEKNARSALDTALQRGGDQVVVKGEGTLDIFGGKTKMPQKRTKVKARVVANELVSYITAAENVVIMFHKYGDFDAFGSAVGLARLAMFCGVPVNIVMDIHDDGLRKCKQWLAGEQEYSSVFIDSASALELVNSKTLLIITDVNNKEQFESPVLAEHCRTVVVIDHHRKTVDFERTPDLTYIEPAAAAASELVAEMLEQVLPGEELLAREADLMMAGILLDTNQFTKNTGTRTFSAALYLRSGGADVSEVQEFFKTELEDFQRELRFHSNVEIYRGITAIATARGECELRDKIPAAKAANSLLNVEGVKASFAIVPIGNAVHISARSSGTINVQLLLEGLRGGGHYDAAGTRISGVTAAEAEVMLKAAIDSYLNETQSEKLWQKEIKK